MGKYFSLEGDWDQLTGKLNSGGERTLAGLKIIGKSIFNVGNFAVTEVIPGIVEHAGRNASDHLEKNHSTMSSEQIENAKELIRNGEQMTKKRKQSDN